MPKIVTPIRDDLPRLAKCHRLAFPDTLSSAMGQTYVEKMLEWYLADDRAFLFLLEEDNKCIGYCGGLKFDGKSKVGSASSMIQYSYNQAIKTFIKKPWLFFHPQFIAKYQLILKNVFRRIIKSKNRPEERATDSLQMEPHTGLIVVGVEPRMQGRGYGSLLLQEFERFSNSIGYNRMMLTVRSSNLRAIRSYQRNGWSEVENNGKSTTMMKRIN